MATILLQAAGGFVGGLIGGPVGAIAGRALGAIGGYAVDSALFSQTRSVEGPRLASGRVLQADEGGGVAKLFGTARIAGQVIWGTRFEEASTTERRGGKGGGGTETEVTTYSYFGNVAIGLCEGPIAGIRRVWADGEEIDLQEVEYRLHLGTEDQMPDPLIEAKQGAGEAPAYRGLAYIVFERMALERWGNRIPQIACEVIRPVGELERSLRAITVIPGASEHGLDPQVVRETVEEGEDRLLNRHVLFGASDFEASMDELQALAPRLERAALVVSWFGNDLRAGHCRIMPGVEVRERNESEEWSVGGTGREGAHLVSRIDGGPAFGGTPSDAGVLRAIRDMKRRGLKVMLYPFVLMDVPPGNALPDPYGGEAQAVFPWRGRITLDVAPGLPGSADRTVQVRADVARFVGTAGPGDFRVGDGEVDYEGPDEWSFRRAVLHQASLARAAGGVDAFVIGSELRSLTRLRDAEDRFPFVEALVALARDVKAILPETTVTYAADWSEYFGYHPADGSGDVFYNLDPLWADPAIDVVGIDNYLPLSDWRDEDWDGGPDGFASPHDREGLGRNIAGGEYFDWYYASEADRQARIRTPITDGAAGKPWVFRTKDIRSWWANRHVERRGGVETAETAWAPCSKPVWFTELGCPAVDKGPNQPNVFIDPKSSESFAPYFSSGERDDLVQRRFAEAHLSYWDPASPEFREENNPLSPVYGGRMVEPSAIHFWTWDARPFPAFPERSDAWSDGGNWRRGHWLTGRLGTAPMGETIAALLRDHGFSAFDVSGVDALVTGYLLNGPASARDELEGLLRLCGIDAFESGGRIVFRSRARAVEPLEFSRFVDEEGSPYVELRRQQASEMPDEVVVRYFDPARAYQPAAASAFLARGSSRLKAGLDLPVVLDETHARKLAARNLTDALAAGESARLSLSPAEIGVETGDLFRLSGRPGRWLVSRTETGLFRRIEAVSVREPGAVSVPGGPTQDKPAPSGPSGFVSRPRVHLLDLPLGSAASPEVAARIAVYAKPARPYAIMASPTGEAFERRATAESTASVGRLAASLHTGPEGVIDRGNILAVDLARGSLFSVSRERLLAGANLCAVLAGNGEWEVLQFERAEETAPMRFELQGLLRAQGGTEDAMRAGAATGAPFVLLDGAIGPAGLRQAEIGRALTFKIVPAGQALSHPASVTRSAALGLRAVRPLSPVHLKGRFHGDGALALRWIRRTRIGGDRWEGIEVPLGEERELYAVRLADAAGRALAMQTEAPALSLDLDEQVAAFGEAPAALTATVRQVSIQFGEGVGRSATVSRAG